MNRCVNLERSCEPLTNMARQALSDLAPARPPAESTLNATSFFTLALGDRTRRLRLELFDFRAPQQSLPSNRQGLETPLPDQTCDCLAAHTSQLGSLRLGDPLVRVNFSFHKTHRDRLTSLSTLLYGIDHRL